MDLGSCGGCVEGFGFTASAKAGENQTTKAKIRKLSYRLGAFLGLRALRRGSGISGFFKTQGLLLEANKNLATSGLRVPRMQDFGVEDERAQSLAGPLSTLHFAGLPSGFVVRRFCAFGV